MIRIRAQYPRVRASIAVLLLLLGSACASEPHRKSWREGTLAREAKDYPKSEAALKRALEEALRVEDDERREFSLAGIEMELGMLFIDTRRFQEALELLTSARTRMRGLASDEVARRLVVVTSSMQIAFVCEKLGDHTRAYQELEQAVKDARTWKEEEERDAMLLMPLLMLADHHQRDQQHEEARALMSEVLSLALKVYGEGSIAYPRFVSIAARQELSAGRIDEAITLFLRAAELKTRNIGGKSGEISVDAKALIAIYTRLGKTEEADRWSARLETLEPSPSTLTSTAAPGETELPTFPSAF